MKLAALKSKAGPLPVWAWSLIVGLVLAIGIYYVRGKSQINNANIDPTAQVPTDPYAAFANYSAAPTTAPTDQGSSGSYETNQSWLAKGVALITGKNLGTALDAQNALTAYMNNGGTLTAAQTKLVNSVLQALGLPPEGVYGNPSGTNPAPPVTTPPPTGGGTKPPTPAKKQVRNYIRSNTDGSIAVVYTDGTKGEFTNMKAYTTFSAKHPAGALNGVTRTIYDSFPTAEKNPTW